MHRSIIGYSQSSVDDINFYIYAPKFRFIFQWLENERAYAEQLLKTFVAAMNMKDEEKAPLWSAGLFRLSVERRLRHA